MNQRVPLSGQKVALFTWHGATVELEGSPELACVPAPPPVVAKSAACGRQARLTRRVSAWGAQLCRRRHAYGVVH